MKPAVYAWAVAVLVAVCGEVVGAATAVPDGWGTLFQEDFKMGTEGWRFTESGAWEARDGALLVRAGAEGRNLFGYRLTGRMRREIAMEATLTVQERVTKEGWSFAGIVVYQDGSSFWMLGLTEAPDGRRYTDFLETHLGAWQAQNEGSTALPPAAARQTDTPWTPGQPYRLRLVLTQERIDAEVLDGAGRQLAVGAYALPATTPAVRAGLPALIARGCQARFAEVKAWAPEAAATATPKLALEAGPKGRVGILLDALPGVDRAAVERLQARLRRQGFGVTALTAAEAADDRLLVPENIACYVIPACRTYPVAGVEALLQYARQGGHIVFLGGPFLDQPLWRVGTDWLSAAQLDERCRQTPPEFRPLAITAGMDLNAWQRSTGNPAGAGSWQAVATGPDGAPCLRYTSSGYENWDGYMSPDMQVFGAGHDLLLFKVQGDAQTPQIAVEIQEEDGSRWIATADAGQGWSQTALRLEAFRYWQDSPTKEARGQPGDRLNPARARRLNFGLAGTHTTAVTGPTHTFQIADLGTGRSPLPAAALAAVAPPGSLESIWPRYKTYAVPGPVTLATAASWADLPTRLPPTAEAVLCAIPRPQGTGFARGQKWRYIPLLRALDTQGQERGAAAWMLLNHDLPYPGSVVLSFGLNDMATLAADGAWGDWIAASIERVLGGCLIAEAGTAQFAYWPGEPVPCGARLRNTGVTPGEWLVTADIRPAGGGEPVWQKRAVLKVEAGSEAIWQDTWQPPTTPAVYQMQVTLSAVTGSAVLDRSLHEVAVLDTLKPAAEDFVHVSEGQFVLHGKPWYPVGVNYWPLYISGLDPGDYWAGWLDPRFYDPDLVELDLARLEGLGINMVSISAHDLAFHRNLLDFLRRCAPHQLKVNLFLGLASPLAYQEEALRTYLETTRIRDNATVFAYDTVWEPGNYVFGKDRGRWDEPWRSWIAERYGNLEAAELDWGVQVPRNEKGQAIAPPERWFREDGDWRVAMAAYRRFMDDLTSSLWGRAHRGLRRLDPNHLISFRQGNTLPHDFVFTGTPKHVDFMCPEGYSIPNSDDGSWAAGFITRYVEFTTRGKPILWSEFGISVWDSTRMEPSVAAIAVQARYHERIYRMVLESGAQGTAPWWWPGGYRVEERSDYGIMNPDGTARATADLIRTYGPQIKTPRARLLPEVWWEFDRDANAGGYWFAAFNTGKVAYREALAAGKVLGVRTPGTGTTSVTAPPLAVGNRPLTGTNPHKYLNAEFNGLQVYNAAGQWVEAADGAVIEVRSGSPVRARASLGNTQEATWVPPAAAGALPGTVFLATTLASPLQGRWPLPAEVPYLGDADFGEFVLAPTLTEATAVDLQMTALDRAWFGERRTFRLQPAAAP
jgi:hypothetical protein